MDANSSTPLNSYVTVYTDAPPAETTSAKAAASFKPHEVAYNDLAHDLLVRAWTHFDRLSREAGDACGVRRQTHWEASSLPKEKQPYFSVVEDVQLLERPHVPGGYAYGWRYTTFFIDTSVYLPWLLGQLSRKGGEVVYLRERLDRMEDLIQLPHPTIFNCTGLGARSLCNDANVYPIKGQIAVVAPEPAMDWSISADGFYVYPRRADTIIGGTTEPHVYTETVDRAALGLLIRAGRRILPHGLYQMSEHACRWNLTPGLDQRGRVAPAHDVGSSDK